MGGAERKKLQNRLWNSRRQRKVFVLKEKVFDSILIENIKIQSSKKILVSNKNTFV